MNLFLVSHILWSIYCSVALLPQSFSLTISQIPLLWDLCLQILHTDHLLLQISWYSLSSIWSWCGKQATILACCVNWIHKSKMLIIQMWYSKCGILNRLLHNVFKFRLELVDRMPDNPSRVSCKAPWMVGKSYGMKQLQKSLYILIMYWLIDRDVGNLGFEQLRRSKERRVLDG